MKPSIKTVSFAPPRTTRYPLYWAAMGEERRDSPRYRWEGAGRGKGRDVLFQLTLFGQGWMRVGNEAPFALGPGTGFVARLPSDHCYYYQKGDPAWRFVWVMWSGSALGAIWESLNKTFVRRIAMSPTSPEIRLLRSTIHSDVDVMSTSLLDSVDAFRFLVAACEERPRQTEIETGPVISTRIDRVYRRQPASSIGKDGIASKLRLSRFQLYRAAKKELGVSPKEWLGRQKVHQACRLLKDESQSIGSIAEKIGFADANYFARFFRSRTGHTPRDWRRLFCR